MGNKLTVLITGLGSTTAQSVIKGINHQNKHETQIVGVDINDENRIAGSQLVNQFYQISPASNVDEYISDISKIINSEGIDLVVPIVDVELHVLSKNRDELPPNTFLLLSKEEVIEICNNKYSTYEWFQQHSIPTTKTLLNPTKDEVISEFSSYPLHIKPCYGVSSRGVYDIRNENELCLLDRVENPIVQPKLEGEEYTIDVFRREGTTVAVPRKRLETRSGISYKGKAVKDEKLIRYGKRISNELGIRGPANIQCFMSDNNEPQFFEINPRFSGSLPLTINAGVNSVKYALDWASGEDEQLEQVFEPITMCRYWSEIYYCESKDIV